MRVIDFSTVVSGPLCAQILGDLGADVIKVEEPRGDFSRLMGPPFREGLSGFFAHFNRNKRSIVIDLKKENGQKLAADLTANADVVIENFRPGVADRIGIGCDALRERNPRLIYVAISGFGPDGPYAALPAYDLVIQGLVGVMPVQGGDGAPVLLKTLVADKCTGMTAASAAVAALLARERNGGVGQRVDVPMLDAFAAYMLPDLVIPDAFVPSEPNPGGGLDIFRTFETTDGHVVGIVIEDRQFVGLAKALNREDLIDKPEYKTLIDRMSRGDELFDLLETEIRKWTTVELVARAREFGAPFAPVNDVAAFFEDPQVVHNGTIFEAEDPRGGGARYLRHPSRFSATPASLRRHPPRLGEHTDEVLEAAGLSSESIASLRDEGAIT